MKIGIGKAEIVFPQEIFPNPRERYTGVHDCPLVHAMLAEAGERFCFVFLDLVDPGDWGEVRTAVAAAAEVPFANTVLHTSHVLSTPHCMHRDEYHSEEERTHDERQRDAILQAALQAVRGAKSSLEEVWVGIGSASCGINANRVLETAEGYVQGINEQGESDHTVPVICIRDAGGALKGVLYTVNTAAAVLEGSRCSDGSRPVSGDIASGSERLLEDMWNANAIYTIGASGDQWPVLRAVWDSIDQDGQLQTADYQEKGFFLVELLSRRLAQSVSQVIPGIPCHPVDAQASLHKLELSFPAHKRLPPPEMRKVTRTITFEPDGEVTTDVYVFTVGDTAVIGCEPELCVSTMGHIREQSPFRHTILMEFTNGLADYMVTEDLYEKCAPQCKKGRFNAGSAEQFEQQIIQFLQKLKER